MRTVPALTLMLALAPWALGGGSMGGATGGGKAKLRGGQERWEHFKGSAQTQQFLSDAAAAPPDSFSEFLRPGEKLPMGKPLRSREGLWWGLITEQGTFEVYCKASDGSFSGPLWDFQDPRRPLSTRKLAAAYDLKECWLALDDAGKLTVHYKRDLIGKDDDEHTEDIDLREHHATDPAKGGWLWLTNDNPPHLWYRDPEAPDMQAYFSHHPESRPKGSLSYHKPKH